MKNERFIRIALIVCLFVGAVSCKKDEETPDQRLINKKNKEAGELFLKNNEAAAGIVTTYSGLQYKIETPATGLHPHEEDSVNVTYTGRLIDGTEFTSATESLLLSKQIAGFREGVRLMAAGATYTLYIPYYLAYNSSSKAVSYNEKTITIQPYSVLIFEITLNSIIVHE